MLAYVFYHWKRNEVSAVGLRTTTSRLSSRADGRAVARLFAARGAYRSPALRGPTTAADSYEDWYLVRGSADLDPLNDAAISASRQVPHDKAASAAAGGTAGLYRLQRRGARSSAPRFALMVR